MNESQRFEALEKRMDNLEFTVSIWVITFIAAGVVFAWIKL